MFKQIDEILEGMIEYGYPLKEPKALEKGLIHYIDSNRYKGTLAPKILLERVRESYLEAKVKL